VDKRVDMIASVLKQGGTVYDLQEIEHAYAPPFSSAKDPVNIAGFVAENIIGGLVKIVHWHELNEEELSRSFILDVREVEEYKLGKIEGAENIPLNSLRDRLKELPRDRRIIVYCAVGLRAYLACRILSQNGFSEVYNLSGGYKTYEFVTEKQANEDIFQGDVIGKDNNIYQTAVEEA
jgi:rhodanese-related sulfurtransferase